MKIKVISTSDNRLEGVKLEIDENLFPASYFTYGEVSFYVNKMELTEYKIKLINPNYTLVGKILEG